MKLYSWNVLYENDPENLRRFVEAHDFDVLCLQEVTWQMLSMLETLPYQIASAVDVARHEKNGEVVRNYVVILSKYPIQETGSVSYPELAVPWQTRVFLTLMRWGTGHGRNALYADLVVEGTVVRVYCAHLTLWTPTNRMREFRLLAATLPSDRPVIVAGDFNILEWWPMKLLNWLLGGSPLHALPWYPERTRIENAFAQHELTNVLKGKRTHKFSRSQLDHILISKDLSVKDAEVLRDSFGSDHQPVAATIAL